MLKTIKRGRIHSEFMMNVFPKQKPTGIDLGNIEIKESTNGFNRIVVCKKDMNPKIDYFLCYNHQNFEFLIVDSQDIPRVKGKTRSVYWNYLKSMAILQTQDYDVIWNKIEELSTFKELVLID